MTGWIVFACIEGVLVAIVIALAMTRPKPSYITNEQASRAIAALARKFKA